MKSNNNYINEAIKNPKYIILHNGKEVKRYAFYRQARNYVAKCDGELFGHTNLEIINAETGEILYS